MGQSDSREDDGDSVTYRTFIRSARNWQEFAHNPKITEDTGLTYTEAVDRCREFRENRTEHQIEMGTLLEFERED